MIVFFLRACVLTLLAMGWMIWGALVLLVLGWLIGRMTTDYWWWSQWLWWIPTPVTLVATLLILLLVSFHNWRKRRRIPDFQNRKWLWGWRAILILLVLYFGLMEHRWFRSPPENPPGLRLVHWTMSHSRTPDQVEQHTKPIIALDGDITILSDAYLVRGSPSFAEWLEQSQPARSIGRFNLFTRLPILELRSLIVNKNIRLHLAIIDATAILGQPLIVYLIDLPSATRYSRMKIVNLTRTMMKDINAPPPDIVVGDFNITRGSASLKRLFPDLHHAWDDAGHGYGASFHRRFPLYHIDHILLAPSLTCSRYDLLDPGLGRHNMQVAHLISE